jgi:hypothetical protein
MIVKLEIPDSFSDQRLTLIAGNKECIATKNPWDNFWEVVTVRCDQCGNCCMGLWVQDKHRLAWPIDDEGRCSQLQDDGDRHPCGAGFETPFRCIPFIDRNDVLGCSVETERQDID